MKARFLALAALVLGMASCQNDFDGASVGVGGEVDFQLSVAVPEFGATRADADGQNGHDSAYGAIDYLSDAEWENVDLRYTLEVYDLAAVNDPDAVPVKDRMTQVVDKYQPVSFDLRLVPGRDYRFVVFADFVDANGEGLHHTLGTNLRQITVKNDKISQELTDAYFATLDVEKLANNATGDIELKRPYGKVRVIATDLHELNLNVEAAKTVVTYDACHPGMFNAVTGAIDSVYEQESYEVVYSGNGAEAYSAYTVGYDDDRDSATNRLSHKTLFTDYILATENQNAIHFTMSVYDKDGGLIKTTNFNTEIPVQRNYLTTVIGNVLTTATEINVTINDNFAGEYKQNSWNGSVEAPAYDAETKTYTVTEASHLAWLAAQVNGTETRAAKQTFAGVKFVLAKDIDLNGELWTPIGATGKFEGTFDGANHIISNLFVRVADKTAAGLFANAKYVQNVTVRNAEVYGHYKVGVIVGNGLCSRIENCHVDGAVVNVVPLNNDDANHVGGIVGYLSGESVGYVKNCSVKNATITAYRDVAAIAGMANQTAVVSGNTVENVTVVADQTATYNGTKAANAAAVVGRVSTKATIENNTVENADVTVVVNTAANLEYQIANAAGDVKVVLGGDIEGDVTVAQKPDVKVTIEGNGYDFAGSIVVDGKSATYLTAGLTIKNINFVAESINADACIRLGNGTNATRYTCNVTVEGCTFNVPGAVGVKSYTGGDKNLTISNCTATAAAHSLLQAKGIDGILVEKCAVNSKNGMNFNNSTNVVVNECTTDVKGYAVRFGEGSASESGAAEVYTIKNSTLKSACEESGDAVVILRGSADNATLTLENTTLVGEPQILNTTIGAQVVFNATEGTLDFSDAAFGAVTLGELKDVTVKGNENTSVIFHTTANSKLENVTIQGINFVYDGSNVNCGIVVNANAQIDNLVIDGCSFTGIGKKEGRGIYGQNPNATIVVKNAVFENMGYPIYTMSGGGYKSLTVEGCTFRLIKSWAVMPQYGEYLGDLTITGNTFENCTGGLVKAGAFTTGHTFTFTNNTITNSTEHPAKDWFTINTASATKVVSGNTKDGVEWTPGEAEGLK